MSDDSDNLGYYKRISNPLCTLSKTQKGMLGNFKKNVSRQTQSRQTRLRILAEKRSRVNHPVDSYEQAGSLPSSDAVSEPSDVSDSLSEETVAPVKPRVPFQMFPPSPTPTLTPTPFPTPNRSPTPNPTPTGFVTKDDPPSEDSELGRKLYEDDLDSRMQNLGIDKQQDESIRTQELRYWRKKVSLEEEAAVKQAGMLLSLLSSFVESFTNAIGFTTIRTQGLSEAIQTALESGDFDLAIKTYCVSPQALNMLKNPATSFMTSFGHVLLRTHIANVKRELEDGVKRFNHKQAMELPNQQHQQYPRPPDPPQATQTPQPHPVSVPWDTRQVVDPSGKARPAFNIQAEATPCIADAFRKQVTSMAPVLSVIKQMTASASSPTPDTTESPSGLSFA
jgi:hypothetical protein